MNDIIGDQVVLTTNQQHMQVSTLKCLLLFAVTTMTLVCMMVGQVFECEPSDKQAIQHCVNWFRDLTDTELCSAYINPDAYQHTYATQLLSDYNQNYCHASDIPPELSLAFQSKLYTDRWQVQQTAQYQVVQTVTTVGYGDIYTYSSDEKIFRASCMIVGCVLFTLASSTIIEVSISDTLNIQKNKDNEAMIEKLQYKYSLKGESKRFLGLLGDSAYTEKLNEELRFAEKLPKQMCNTVLNSIFSLYVNKMLMFKYENLSLFKELMDKSYFRRCVINENLMLEDDLICIVYSGHLGVSVFNCKDQLNKDYLQQVNVGEEVGYLNQINQYNQQETILHQCLTNCEIIELPSKHFYDIMLNSNKGLEQIKQGLLNNLINLYIIVCIQKGMMKDGMYIDFKWFSKTKGIFKLLNVEQDIMNNVIQKMNNYHPLGEIDSMNSKEWFNHFVDRNTKDQIELKAMIIIKDMIKSEQIELLTSDKLL